MVSSFSIVENCRSGSDKWTELSSQGHGFPRQWKPVYARFLSNILSNSPSLFIDSLAHRFVSFQGFFSSRAWTLTFQALQNLTLPKWAFQSATWLSALGVGTCLGISRASDVIWRVRMALAPYLAKGLKAFMSSRSESQCNFLSRTEDKRRAQTA